MDRILAGLGRFLTPVSRLDLVAAVLGRSILYAWAILLFWFLAIALAGDTVYKWQSRFFRISREDFDRVCYLSMAIFKILIALAYFIPYLAIRASALRRF